MQTSSPTSPKPVEPKSILLIGPPGGGKTTLAMGFPSVAFMDLDRNLDGPERFLRKVRKDLSYAYEHITYKDGVAIPVEQWFDRLMDTLLQVKNLPEIKTVVIDGLTMVNEAIVQKVLKEQSTKEVKTVMEPHFWGPFKTRFINLLVGRLRVVGKTSICTCHETILERPSNDKAKMLQPELIGYRPAINGGITDYFGGFFTDMLRCTAEPATGSKVEYRIDTARTALSDLKNSVGMPASIIVKDGEIAYDKIKPYFEL